MKKLVIALAIVLSFLSPTAFAGGRDKVPSREAVKTFEKEFKGATNIVWEAGKEVVRVSFNLNNYRVLAFFDDNGELVGTARSVLFDQLPLASMNRLTSRFENGSFYDLVEYTIYGDIF